MSDTTELKGESRERANDVNVANVAAPGILEVDATINMDSSEEDTFISPRTRILEAKSTEEEITISQSKVKARHEWIEETLLTDKKSTLSENTQKLLARHSLPRNSSALIAQRTAKDYTSPSLASLTPRSGGDSNDVLARARKAIEGRKKSRDAAKARVSADMASMSEVLSRVSTSHATSPLKADAKVVEREVKEVNEDANERDTSHAAVPLKDNTKVLKAKQANEDTHGSDTIESVEENEPRVSEGCSEGENATEKNDARAKAKARLNTTLPLLGANSSVKPSVSKSLENSLHSDGAKSHGACRIASKSDAEADRRNNKDSGDQPPVEEREETVTSRSSTMEEDAENNIQVEATRLDKPQTIAEAPKIYENLELEQNISPAGTERLDQERLAVNADKHSAAGQFEPEKERAAAKAVNRDKAAVEKEQLEQENLAGEAEKHDERLEQERSEESARLEQEKLFAETERLEREKLAAEAESQAEFKRREMELIEQERTLAKQNKEEEEARRLSEAQAEAGRLKHARLSANVAKQSEIETRAKQEGVRTEQRLTQKGTRRLALAKAKRLQRERLAAEATKQADLEGPIEELTKYEDEEATVNEDNESVETSQPSLSFTPIVNASTSCSIGSDPLSDKHSESSEGSASLGKVDRILYQGNFNDLDQEDDLHQDVSDDEEYDAVANRNEIESQPSNIKATNSDCVQLKDSASLQSSSEAANTDDVDLSTVPLSAGPMWKRAVEEAAFNSAVKNDFLQRDAPVATTLDSSPSTAKDTTDFNKHSFLEAEHGETEPSDSYSNYGYHEDDAWVDGAETDEQEAVGLREWKGFKRNRMMYMVVIGILAGLFPSLYVQSTCHFITGDVAVGDDEVEFGLYYGLHKFTPIDSAFQGYSYCQDYDANYNYNPPMVPRLAGVAATIFGTIPLIVIGVQIQYSMTHKILWIGSMWMLYIGFVCQISTLSIFLLDLCADGIQCSMGPGAWASEVSSLTWFLLSIEMKINSPLIQPVQSNGVVVIEKDSLIVLRMKKLWRRIHGEGKAPSLSRTAMKMQKDRIGKGETELGHYRPPEMV